MEADLTVVALIVSAVGVLLAAIYWYISLLYGHFDKQGITGPKPCFPLGTWNKSARKFIGAEDIQNNVRFGPIIGTYDGLKPNLLVNDIEAIKEILLTSSDKFKDRRADAATNSTLKRILKILGNEDQRDVNTFIGSSVGDLKLKKLTQRLETCTNAMARGLLKSRENGKVLVNTSVTEFVQDASALVLLGVDLNADPVFRQGFIKQTKQVFAAGNINSPLAILPFLYSGGDSWILPRNSQEYFRSLILSKIKERSGQENIVESKAADFIDILLEASAEEKKLVAKEKAQDEEEGEDDLLLTDSTIANQVLATLLVFNHWLRSTLIFSIRVLATSSDIQAKLLTEVSKIKVVEKLTYETIEHLPYLDMFLWEVLRCHPTEFRLERVVDKEVTVKGNINLPIGTNVSIPLFALHKSATAFHEPEVFNPENFNQEKMEKRSPYTFLPFGQAGVHAPNISYQIGVLLAKWALFKLVSKAKFSTDAKTQSQDYKHGVTGVPLPDDIEINVESRI